MTNSERAAADQRLMDAMDRTPLRGRVYVGDDVVVVQANSTYPVLVFNHNWKTISQARQLHRELGEALAAIEAQFGEKPADLITDAIRERTLQLYREKIDAQHKALNASCNAVKANRDSFGKKPESIVPPNCTGPGAPCGCSIHFTPGRPFGEAFTMNYPAPTPPFYPMPPGEVKDSDLSMKGFARFGERLAAGLHQKPALFDTEGVYVEKPQSITVLKPEDAPGARETIWGSWSDLPYGEGH